MFVIDAYIYALELLLVLLCIFNIRNWFEGTMDQMRLSVMSRQNLIAIRAEYNTDSKRLYL